jgi:hypothetical protein
LSHCGAGGVRRDKDLDVRLPAAFSFFAVSLIVLTPFQAMAQETSQSVAVQDRPRPEYDPLGMRLGGFDLNARLDLGVTSTDNLFAAEEGGEQSDVFFTISPSMRLASHWSRHALEVRAGATQSQHNDFSTENTTTWYLSGLGRLDVGRDTQISAGARVAREMEPRTNPDALATGKPTVYTIEGVSLTAQQRLNRFLVSGTVDRTTYDYHDNDFRDMTQDGFTGRVEAELTPRIGLVGIASIDHRDYDQNPGLSSDGQTYMAGVALHLTDLLLGEATAGRFERKYDDGTKVTGAAVAANLEWYLTRLTTIDFTGRRSVGDNGAYAAAPFVDSAYGAYVHHELLRNVILTAGGEVGTRDYRGIDRNDDYSSAIVRAEYILNRRVALTAQYHRDEVSSAGADRYRDFTVNAVTLGVSLRL